MKQMPQIQKFMTAMPHTIGKDIPIKQALGMMREHQIRHLPVQVAGHLTGVLTDRDLKLAASFVGAEELKVEDVMTPDPYTVAPETPLDRVVLEMAEHKYGCAIVRQQNGKVVGIFTATDGLRVLAETLGSFYKAAV
jgi:acetoin utilization protein AcuB